MRTQSPSSRLLQRQEKRKLNLGLIVAARLFMRTPGRCMHCSDSLAERGETPFWALFEVPIARPTLFTGTWVDMET